MKITKTRTGLRLSQHGVVISELRTTAGPTHSVFDVLAALLTLFGEKGRLGMLGFAGGGVVAPLRRLGFLRPFDAVDLDEPSYQLFTKHCAPWAPQVQWHHAEAAAWLRAHRCRFHVLIEDLSIPLEGDVIKPEISWTLLPPLIRQHLKPQGVAIFNLLPPPQRLWSAALAPFHQLFPQAQLIELEEFENRILIVGNRLPETRSLGKSLRTQLRQLGSNQSDKIKIRTSL